MCILINHPANTNFSDELLADFYDFNSDGFGAMYAEAGKLVIIKTLGKPDEIEALYKKELAHRDCIIHYRMKTHGDIDLDNCHPYRINDDIWMAHNGILAMGNPIDKRKSDTWHFIEYIIRPALAADPDLIFDLDYQEYLENMIGGTNKFAFMHKSGKSVILNEQAGVTHQGAWLSNTYAWSAHKHGHGYKYGTTATASKYYASAYDDFDDYGTAYGSTKHSSKSLAWDEPVGEVRVKSDKKFNYDKVMRAAYNCYKRGSSQLVDWVITAPEKAEFLLLEWYGETYPQEMQEIVNIDPEEAAMLIGDLFEGGSVNEGSLI
jgi:predicted glutamine amidotransferase